MTTQAEAEWIEEAMHLVEQYAKTIVVTMHVSSAVRLKKNTAALDAIRAHLATRPAAQVPEESVHPSSLQGAVDRMEADAARAATGSTK